jgi:hypothetical protein
MEKLESLEKCGDRCYPRNTVSLEKGIIKRIRTGEGRSVAHGDLGALFGASGLERDDRLTLRARWLAFALAVSHVRRIDDRLLLLFWHLADRRGRMTGEGVVVPLRLSHQAIATLIGAQRPTVSTALGQLRERGLLERTADDAWLLRGEPPAPTA